MKAETLVVLIRDIARAERMGHCTHAYLDQAAEILRASDEPKAEPESERKSA